MKTWKLYLSGEIHTDWREQIEAGARPPGCRSPSLRRSPTTRPPTIAASRSSAPKPDKFWHDHKGAQMNAIRTRTLISEGRRRRGALRREIQAVERRLRCRLCRRARQAADRPARAGAPAMR